MKIHPEQEIPAVAFDPCRATLEPFSHSNITQSRSAKTLRLSAEFARSSIIFQPRSFEGQKFFIIPIWSTHCSKKGDRPYYLNQDSGQKMLNA